MLYHLRFIVSSCREFKLLYQLFGNAQATAVTMILLHCLLGSNSTLQLHPGTRSLPYRPPPSSGRKPPPTSARVFTEVTQIKLSTPSHLS